MNICFISGTIISDIEFKFILNSKDISISYFDLQLRNNNIIKVIAYNEMADYCWSKLKKNDFINIQGYLNPKYEVILEEINCIS